MTTLAIAVAQPSCRSRDVEANARVHAQAIRSAGARVVVFPELSLTGYELDAAPVAPDDPRLAPVREACQETGCLALVGAPVAGEDGVRHIAMLAVDAESSTVAYRKMHLGGDEPGHFEPGKAPAVIDVDGWRLGLAICKDTRIPEQPAATAALGIDVYVAGVCEMASDDAEKDRRARRIATEYRVWVAVASFAGPTGGGFNATAGHSTIWTPDGAQIARAGAQPGDVVSANVVRAGEAPPCERPKPPPDGGHGRLAAADGAARCRQAR